MFPNVRAEFARLNLTLEVVAKELDLTTSTLCQKLKGKYPLTLNEAKRIKQITRSKLTLEELFSEAVEE